MFHEFDGKLGDGFSFWSNATGDLHHNGSWLDRGGVPQELLRAYDELWSDGFAASCYLAEFDGKYGIAVQAGYDSEFASDSGMSYESLLSAVTGIGRTLSERYPQYEVIFGKDTCRWSDGSVESELILFVPWDVDAEDFECVAEHFDSVCYEVAS